MTQSTWKQIVNQLLENESNYLDRLVKVQNGGYITLMIEVDLLLLYDLVT